MIMYNNVALELLNRSVVGSRLGGLPVVWKFKLDKESAHTLKNTFSNTL